MTPTRGGEPKSERLNFRFSTTPRVDSVSEAGMLDARAVHRALTGIRDRLRLQEDELDRLREPSGNVDAVLARVEEIRTELYAHVEQRLNEQASSRRVIQIPAPAPALDETVLPKLNALETKSAEQSRLLQDAFETMARTETNLRRLIVQVDRLLEDVARRPQPNPQQIDVTSEATSESSDTRRSRARGPRRGAMFTAVEDLDEFEQEEEPHFRWKVPLVILMVLILIFGAVLWYFRDSVWMTPTAPLGAEMSPIDQARAYETDRNYPKAEEIYRELLAKDPSNAEVIRHLAAVLYREDKFDESAEVSKKLTSGSSISLPAPAPDSSK